MNKPSTNGADGAGGLTGAGEGAVVGRPGAGRAAGGRFALGNRGGPGNPFAGRVAALRVMLLEAVTDDDLRAVVAKLLTMAKAGDMAAIREVLDRCLGKPLAGVAVDVRGDVGHDGPGVRVIEDGDWYGNVSAIIDRVQRQPEYLEFLRHRAMADDKTS